MMRNKVIYQNEQTKTVGTNDVLKVTALAYLKEALFMEAYERCAEIIAKAKDFGATPEEVREVVEEHNWGIKWGLPCKAKQVKGGRRRF